MIVITFLQTFSFDFDWHKNVDNDLKHEIDFSFLKKKKKKRSIESLADNKIKNETEQLLSKYKQRNFYKD